MGRVQRNRRAARSASVLAGAVLVLMAGGVAAPAQEPSEHVDVAIIVHPSNRLDGLSLDGVRALFDLKTRFWPDGKPVRVVLPAKDLVEREVLLRKVYRLGASQLAKRWRERIFAGEISGAPSGAASPEALVRAVAVRETAVAAVRMSAITDEVRVVPIDGHLPGDPKYPLR